MSDKLTMPAIDKVSTRIQVRATTYVRLEVMQRVLGLKSMNAAINAGLEEAVKKIPFGEAEQKRLNEIMNENEAKRRAAKAKKGLI